MWDRIRWKWRVFRMRRSIDRAIKAAGPEAVLEVIERTMIKDGWKPNFAESPRKMTWTKDESRFTWTVN